MKFYVFFLISLLILFSGCADKQESVNSSGQANITPISSQTPDQAFLYKESFTKYSRLINFDASTLVSDSVSSSRTGDLINQDSQTLIDDIEKANQEVKEIDVPTNYKDGYYEYILALDSYNAAGNSINNVGNNVDEYTNYMKKANEGTEHMEKAVILFNAESGSNIELKKVIKFT